MAAAPNTRSSPGILLAFDCPPGGTVSVGPLNYVLFVVTRLTMIVAGAARETALIGKNDTPFFAASVPDTPHLYDGVNEELWLPCADSDSLTITCSAGMTASGFFTGYWWAPAS